MGGVSRGENLLSQYLSYWDNFKDFFGLISHSYRVMPAVTEELKLEAFKVRHKVYCAELGYEKNNFHGVETDNFDSHSTQMVVYSRAVKAYVGCLRLVHGRHNDVLHNLPMELHCAGKLDQKIIDMVKQSGHRYAEVSRLAIDKNFRHIGRKDVTKALGKEKKSSFVLISLYLGLQALARQQNVRYLLAIVEPRLLKNLHRHEIPAFQIGEAIEHRGLRVPILIDTEDIENIIPSVVRPLYNLIHRDISSLLEPITERTGNSEISLSEMISREKKRSSLNT